MLQKLCRDYEIRNEFLATFLLLLPCCVLNIVLYFMVLPVILVCICYYLIIFTSIHLSLEFAETITVDF
jgi:hypothetical protein